MIHTDKDSALAALHTNGHVLVDSEALAAEVAAGYPCDCQSVPLRHDDTLAMYGSEVSKVLIETYVLQDVRRLLRDERERAGIVPFGEPLL